MQYHEFLNNEITSLEEELKHITALRKVIIVPKKQLSAANTYWLTKDITKHFNEKFVDCFITVKLVGKDWVVAYNLNKQHTFYFEDLLAEAESASMQKIVTEIKPSPYTKRIVGITLKNYSDEDVATFEQYLLDSNLVVLERTKLKNGASYELYRAVDSLTIPLTSMLDNTASSLIKGLQREHFKDATSVVLRVMGSTEDCDTFAKELINKVRAIARYLDKEVDGYQSRRYFNNVFVLRGGDDFEFWEDF